MEATRQGEDPEEVLAAKATTMALAESPRDWPKGFAVDQLEAQAVVLVVGTTVAVDYSKGSAVDQLQAQAVMLVVGTTVAKLVGTPIVEPSSLRLGAGSARVRMVALAPISWS